MTVRKKKRKGGARTQKEKKEEGKKGERRDAMSKSGGEPGKWTKQQSTVLPQSCPLRWRWQHEVRIIAEQSYTLPHPPLAHA